MEYASIDLRIDVPHLAKADRGDLEGDIAPGEIARLRGGPIAHTSPLLSVVACDPSVAPEEQEKRIREATIFLTNHPEEALAMFFKAHPDLDDAINRAQFAATVPRFAKRPAALDRGRYQRFAEFLKAKGLIDTVPAVANYAEEPE